MENLNLKFGADPEVFSTVLIDNKHFVVSPALLEKDSGLYFLDQDMYEKHPIYIDEDNYSWMMDGVAWELTIKRPLNSASEIHNILTESLVRLDSFLSGYSWQGHQLNLFTKPVVSINPEWYLPYVNENLKMYQGFIFGCDEDYDAVESNYKCKNRDVSKVLVRYGGGHIHISGIEEFEEFPRQAIWFLSMTIGNFCVINSPYPELELLRSKEYGKPGRFRPQRYRNGEVGVEYRSPSNSWISFSEEKMEELFDWAKIGCFLFKNKRTDLSDKFLNETCQAIIHQDASKSSEILNEIKRSA